MFINGVLLLLAACFNGLTLPKLYYSLRNSRSLDVGSLRKLEKHGLRITKLTLDIVYFKNCLELGVCPKFLRFKPPKLRVYQNPKSIYDGVISKQISILERERISQIRRYNSLKNQVCSKINFLEEMTLMSLLTKCFNKSSVSIQQRHKRKLLALWKDDRVRSPDCLINISDRELNAQEENVLRFGLKHHVPPKKVDLDTMKVNIEKTVSSATRLAAGENVNVNEDFEEVTQEVHIPEDFKDNIKVYLNSFMIACKNICSTKMNQFFHKTLSLLSRDKTIKVCKFDKGTGVVIMNSSDYFSKLDKIVSDKSKFQEVPVKESKPHPIIAKENSVKYYLETYLMPFIPEDLYRKLVPSGSQPGKLYGLCKVHKEDFPLRPVISMIGSGEYDLAKYLDKLIKPHIPDQFMVSSTSQFLDRLKSIFFLPTDRLVSFDVVSLFTNVPLNETIKIISNYLYPKGGESCLPFPKKSFDKLMKIATGGLFMYQDKFYTQTDGVAMGNPLGPTLANFFLAHLETTKLNNFPGSKPKMYLRYVDDIFAVFEEESHIKPFFDYLNKLHKNLAFTTELGTRTLPFLNVEVEVNANNFNSWVYRKKTHTGVLLHFSAIVPGSWKTGLVMCLLHQARTICSSDFYFQREVSKLKEMFYLNGYPKSFFDRAFQKFLNKENDDVVPTVDENTEDIITVNLNIPYLGEASNKFAKQMTSLFKSTFNIKLLPVFTSTKVGDYFSLKSGTPLPYKSNVVYQFHCLRDAACSYIGQSRRHLMIRVKEHLSLHKPEEVNQSEIKKHIYRCPSCSKRFLNVDNFKILKKCKTGYETVIHEALKIKKLRPKLNKQLMKGGVSYLLKVF